MFENKEEKKITKKNIIDNINWFIILLCGILQIALNIISIKEGKIIINDFSNKNAIDWTFWGVMTFAPVILALTVSSTFNKEGIRKGKILIKEYIDNYNKLLYINIHKKVRSEKEYLKHNIIKNSIKKIIITLITSFIATELLLDFNYNNILKIIINLSTWCIFGFIAYNNGYNFVKEELKEWYILETEKLRQQADIKYLPAAEKSYVNK